ncbi:hypothetical protein [Paracoccus aerodenitrificans]|uniref:hypothetical protein n=1 Tax=Paracoccus aerodenitrificans TaxID=3017781 RepID=UPI0022F10AD2|nr:hypothetical protein [Paracoccus aerodenitrificans]WBU65216.1 hypothetical protein PAE61_07260 [Paracoccus aerodenitrificans]
MTRAKDDPGPTIGFAVMALITAISGVIVALTAIFGRRHSTFFFSIPEDDRNSGKYRPDMKRDLAVSRFVGDKVPFLLEGGPLTGHLGFTADRRRMIFPAELALN